jgi:hypothetical protein
LEELMKRRLESKPWLAGSVWANGSGANAKYVADFSSVEMTGMHGELIPEVIALLNNHYPGIEDDTPYGDQWSVERQAKIAVKSTPSTTPSTTRSMTHSDSPNPHSSVSQALHVLADNTAYVKWLRPEDALEDASLWQMSRMFNPESVNSALITSNGKTRTHSFAGKSVTQSLGGNTYNTDLWPLNSHRDEDPHQTCPSRVPPAPKREHICESKTYSRLVDSSDISNRWMLSGDVPDFELSVLSANLDLRQVDNKPEMTSGGEPIYQYLIFDQEKEEAAGGIRFAVYDDEKMVYVFAVSVDPEYQRTNAFMKLISPLIPYRQQGYEIEASFVNYRLKNVIDRWLKRGSDFPNRHSVMDWEEADRRPLGWWGSWIYDTQTGQVWVGKDINHPDLIYKNPEIRKRELSKLYEMKDGI